MDSYPIDFPSAEAPETPVNTTARTLGIHPYAVALLTLGWPVAPRAYHREQSTPGGMNHTWFAGGSKSRPDRSIRAAARAIEALTLTGDKALAPEHPLRAALIALNNLAALQRWQQDGGPVPQVHAAGPFLTIRDGLQPRLWHQGEPVQATANLALMAAAITVGFIPWPDVVSGPNGEAGLAFAATSSLQPELTFTQIAQASLPPQDFLGTRFLPGADPEEHPFFYALQACRNVAPMLAAQNSRSKNPICEKQNPYVEQRRALVTNSLLEGKDALSRKVKAALAKHLKSTAA